MDYEVSKPVSQGSDRTQDSENSRIRAVADELQRLCAIYETQCRDSQTDVSHFEAEQRAAEMMAKAGGYWIPMMDVFELGVPGPSGNENDTYVDSWLAGKLLEPTHDADPYEISPSGDSFFADKRNVKAVEDDICKAHAPHAKFTRLESKEDIISMINAL